MHRRRPGWRRQGCRAPARDQREAPVLVTGGRSLRLPASRGQGFASDREQARRPAIGTERGRSRRRRCGMDGPETFRARSLRICAIRRQRRSQERDQPCSACREQSHDAKPRRRNGCLPRDRPRDRSSNLDKGVMHGRQHEEIVGRFLATVGNPSRRQHPGKGLHPGGACCPVRRRRIQPCCSRRRHGPCRALPNRPASSHAVTTR